MKVRITESCSLFLRVAVILFAPLFLPGRLSLPAAAQGEAVSPPAPAESPAALAPLTSACEYNYPPFCFINPEGHADGFSCELLRAAAQAMGREVTFRAGPWSEVRGWLENGEVQALPLVGRTPEREAIFDFTFAYMSLHGAIVVRTGTKGIYTLEDLRGKRVAVMKGDNAEEFLRREERGMEIITTSTFDDALRNLSRGQYDAVVIQRLVALRLIREMGLSNLQVINRPIEGFRQDFCFAVKEGDRETLALLNEGLALVIADGTYRQLHVKWFAAMELPSNRRIVVGGDDNYPPYEFLDAKGRPAGYNVELVRAIARELNLDIEIRLGPWDVMVQGLESGEIDMMAGMYFSLERDKKFDFSPPHSLNHCVSVVRKGEGSPPSTVNELKGKRIIVQQGDIMHNFALEHGLESQVTAVENQEDVLAELAAGRHDCALVARSTALYLIEKNGWTGLAAGQTPLLSPEYCFAVRNGQKALLAQFTEGLNILERTGEYRRIQEKWLGVSHEGPLRLLTLLRYVGMVAGPLLILLLFVFVWSWSLRREVARRTAELRKNEAQFRSIVEAAPEAIFIQTHARFAYLNPAALQLFGAQEAEQILGSEVIERFHPSFREIIKRRIEQLNIERQAVPLIEEICLRLDGGEVPVEAAAVPIEYEGASGALVFVRDITERKRSEAALRETHDLYRAAISQADAVPYVLDYTAKKYAFLGEGIIHLTGYAAAEFYPLLWSQLRQEVIMLGESAGLSFSEAARRTVAGEIARWKADYRIRARGGEERWIADSAVQIFDENNHLLRSIGILQDITERKQSERRIEHLNRVLRAIRDINQLIVHERDRAALIREGCRLLVENRGYSTALIILTDQDNHPILWDSAGMGESFAPISANLESGELPACCAFVQSSETVVLIEDREVICGDCPIARDYVNSDVLFVRLIHGTQCYGYLAVSLEHRLGVDEEERNLFAEMAGDLAYALHVLSLDEAREASERERKSLEEQLMQSQKLEAIGRLAGGVAHDFNNILLAIMSYSEMLVESLPEGSESREFAREIAQGADRAAALTRQLLAFARKQDISPRVLDLNETVAGMLNMLSRLIGEDIDLLWKPAHDIGPVRMDPSQIDQILANLIVNARDAIQGAGKITIETAMVDFDAAYCEQRPGYIPGQYVLLAVSDNGMGIEKRALPYIFEPFFTTKPQGKGTGLGLSTVYGIVKQNKGFINVYSEPDQGTTFRIYLPLYTGEPPAGTDKRESVSLNKSIQTGTETLLLVEDDAALLKLTRRLLESLGYTVLAAENPAQALDLVKNSTEPIHLLVTDVVMPGMNGRELWSALAALRPGLKCLYVSGYTANVIAHHGVLEADVHFLPKPFSTETLAAKLREALAD